MKHIIMKHIVMTCFIMLAFLSACKKKEDITQYDEARYLFDESTKLIQTVTADIAVATDSISIDSLSKVFEKKIVEINFSYPPQTDLKLTEQENDSIYKLMQTMLALKEEKLSSFSKIIETDTID